MSQRLLPCLAISCMFSAAPALASSSDWIETDGGRVRLVTAGMPDASGRLRGALEIALNSGWKTYWRDPGDAGIPPSMDLAGSINVASAEIGFPPPKRFDDGYSVWAGYDRPVSLPVTFSVTSPDRFSAIEAKVFLGVCETVCIPVQGTLSLEPASDPENAADIAAVEAAFAALPAPATADFGISDWRLSGKRLVVNVMLPEGGAEAELFLAGEGYVFGIPEKAERDGKSVFEVDIIGRPADSANAAPIDYVLATGEGSVSGALPPP